MLKKFIQTKTGKMKKYFYVIFIFLSQLLIAQQLKVSADKTTVQQNERFQIYYEFEAANLNSIKSFRPPSFKGLNVISGPNQSSSMQIINGQMSAAITFSFILFGSQPGTYSVSPASIIYEGKEYSSGSITINVGKGSGNQPNSSVGKESNISREEIAKNVFIIASADKASAFKGEQVTVTYKLYTKLDISSPQISKLPTYKDFWAEEIEMSNNIQLNVEMYKGERYRTAVLKKVALFPTADGRLSVTPFELNIPVIITRKRASRDVFDEFFNDPFFQQRETVEFLARSNKIVINVKPFPVNKPKSFDGAVGNFKLKNEISKTQVKTNESVTYKISLSGTGNIKLINIPDVNFPAGIDKYEPKVNESSTKSAAISGSKTIEYLIVPRISGRLTIPGFEFSFFNPSTNSYVTLKAEDKIIDVKKGKGDSEGAEDYLMKEEIKLLSQDIRFIKLDDFNLQKKEDTKTLSTWFFVSIIFALVAFALIVLLIKRNRQLNKNARLFKYLKAEKFARRRLNAAEMAMKESNHFVFYDEIAKAMQGYLEDKFGISKATFTKDLAIEILTEKEVDGNIVLDIKEILEKCEFMKYSPSTEKSIYAEFYQKTLAVIVSLENIIGSKKR